MFNQTLQKIIKRQNYIDQLSDQQISTIQTKQLFFKALQQSPNIDSFNYQQSNQKQQKLFLSPNIDGPATNLLKHILPATQNSYQQIQQLQARINLFNCKKLNQIDILKTMFEQQGQQIKGSGLKVSDFLQLYQSEQMQQEYKDINDGLIKKITTYFETNTKQYSLYQILRIIIQGVCELQQQQKQDNSKSKMMRKIRQSVCSLQGFNISIEDDQNQFNEQTKKQMDKILSYYHNILQVFDIQNQQ